jgi:uncharacterized protein YybS (DUF2232 family)
LFAFSTLFPIVAGVWNVATPPRWLGVADVVFAVLLLVSAFTVVNRAKPAVSDVHRVAALRFSQVVLNAIPLLLVLFFLLGDRVAWTVLVIGLAWRAWLLLYVLPFLVASWRDEPVEVRA